MSRTESIGALCWSDCRSMTTLTIPGSELMRAYADAAPPTVLTSVPLKSKMMNVTAFVDVANIAQYTQKQVR